MSSKSTDFSSSSTEVLERTLAQSESLAVGLKLEEAYEVDSTCKQIVTGGYQRIALQFPDELLHDSIPVYHALRSRLPIEIELYVLADTTFGPCCADEIAAEHVNANLIVHYGHACLSPTIRLPVIHVFGKRPIESQEAAQALAHLALEELKSRSATVLMYDVAYAWKAAEVRDALQDLTGFPVLLSKLDQKSSPAHSMAHGMASCDCETKCGARSVEMPPSQSTPLQTTLVVPRQQSQLPNDCDMTSCVILYLGEESLALTNLLMTHAGTPVYSYAPSTREARLESNRTNKLLLRRYAATQKAKDADVFGIVVGTLGVASYLPLISHLRSLLRRHRKKAYTLAVGKLNPAKLANYQEIECFVLVACGENSLVENSKALLLPGTYFLWLKKMQDFYRPIVTPFELEVALGERRWTGSEYILALDQLLSLPGDTNGSALEDDPDGPAFSAVTGKYRTVKKFGDTVQDPELGALSIREGSRAVAEAMGSAAGLHLAERSYVGLDPRYDRDAPARLETGRVGIAREYGDDHRV